MGKKMERVYGSMLKIMQSLKMGETVLVIYRESLIPEFTFMLLIKYASENGMGVLVDDIGDSLFVLKQHLDFLGIDTSAFENVDVIKVGGRKKVGRIFKHIPIEGLYREKYRLALEEYYRERDNILNVVLGMEYLFYISSEPMMSLISEITSYLGNKNRIAVYLISREIAENAPVNPMPFLERIASTVIYAEPHPRKASIRVGKASSVDLVGRSFIVGLDEILGEEHYVHKKAVRTGKRKT